MDLEAVEMALRAAMHRAGAAALAQLLRFPEPAADQRVIPCPCGHQARYRERRARRVFTALGEVELSRPWYLCPHCHQGQFPVDQELDIVQTEFSPGVRRMQALVGQDASFDHGREQMKLLAGLEVTTKSVERVAETIGADIAQCEQQEIDRAVQLDLPIIVGEPVPIVYVQMDGTGVPVVKKEAAGRKGKLDDLPAHTREAKLGCVFTQTGWDEEGFAIRDPESTTYTGAIEGAEQFGKRIYVEAWKRGWSRAEKKVVIGDGAEWIWNIAQEHFPGTIQIVDCITHDSTYGTWHACSIPMTPSARTLGSASTRNAGSTKARSTNSLPRYAPFKPPTPIWPKRFATKLSTSPPTRLG